MMRNKLTICLSLLFLGISISSFGQSQQWGLRVSDDGHFLQQKNGQPFIWMGSTSWTLHQNISREDVLFFLDDAKEKQFNVIQLMTANKWALNDFKNYFGDTPYLEKNPTRLNPAYWNHLGWVIDQAADRGFYVLLVYGTPGRKDEGMPYVQTATEAYFYGNSIGLFLKDKPNIIWGNGIDINPDSEKIGEMGMEGWHAMAEGVTDGVNGVSKFDNLADYNSTLMTYHTQGTNTSSTWFQTADWLDFNGTQIGLSHKGIIYNKTSADYNKIPIKPTINIEPWYEKTTWVKDSPVGDWEMRIQGYQSFFAGAAGFTYGHWNIYPFDSPDENGALKNWKEHLDDPGRIQMKHLRKLLESSKISYWIPGTDIITSSKNNDHLSHFVRNRISAITHLDKNYVLIYSPQGVSFTVDLGQLKGEKVVAAWFDTRTGKIKEIGNIAIAGEKEFDPPGTMGNGNDWVLILESI